MMTQFYFVYDAESEMKSGRKEAGGSFGGLVECDEGLQSSGACGNPLSTNTGRPI